MAAADHLRPEQMSFFNKNDYKPEPIDVSSWLRHDTVWHSSLSPTMPDQSPRRDTTMPHGHGLGFHVGTPWAALERDEHMQQVNFPFEPMRAYHPLQVVGEETPHYFDDYDANYSDDATSEVRAGRVVPYENAAEDQGSLSLRAPRDALRTWRESVLADPYEYSLGELRAAHRGYDLVFGANPPYRPARRPGITASPIEIQPSTYQSLENLASQHFDPEYEAAEHEAVLSGEHPEIGRRRLYPRLVKKQGKKYPPASEAIHLPGMEPERSS